MANSHVSKRAILTFVLMLATVCFASSSTVSAQQHLPLTNASVIKLVRAGFKDKTIIAIIRSRTNRFNLDPDRLIELKRNGVNENIILAMLSQNDAAFFAEDGWGSDPFFNDGRKKGNPAGNETDIFGSSSSSSGETKSRGESGASGSDGITTGTATVRIIRPPTEAGGAALKLEKTPTLTNDSIINLVAAGFSEGTIIKRIESSPADFDLSPAKVAELRKRRVTDPIIAAMSDAMDGSEAKAPTSGTGGEK